MMPFNSKSRGWGGSPTMRFSGKAGINCKPSLRFSSRDKIQAPTKKAIATKKPNEKIGNWILEPVKSLIKSDMVA